MNEDALSGLWWRKEGTCHLGKMRDREARTDLYMPSLWLSQDSHILLMSAIALYRVYLFALFEC